MPFGASTLRIKRSSSHIKPLVVLFVLREKHLVMLSRLRLARSVGVRSASSASSTPQPSASSVASIIDRLRAIQPDSPASRLRVKAPSDIFRITVVGDTFAGKQSLVNALLEGSRDSQIISEERLLTEALAPESFVRITHGSEPSVDNGPAVQDVRVNVEWLKTFNSAVFILPADASTLVSADVMAESDLTVLVTNATSPLSSKVDVDFLQAFAGAPNLIIAANAAVPNVVGREEAVLAKYINARIKTIADGVENSLQVPVFSVNSAAAGAALTDTAAETFQKNWIASGMQELKTRIFQSAQPEARASVQLQSTLHAARVAANALRDDAAQDSAVLRAVEMRVRGPALDAGIQIEQDRLRRGFVERDLLVVEETVGGVVASCRATVDRVGLFGIVLGAAGDIAERLRDRVRKDCLEKAEFQMTYAVGKLNEGLYTLYARTRSELTSLSSDTHPLAAYTTGKALQSDISRIIDILDKQTPSKSTGLEVETYVLRNVVANGFDGNDEVDWLQSKADSIVRSLFGSQLLFVAGGIFATYLGVPWAISIPSTGIVMAGGIGIYSLRWASVKDTFISKTSQKQKSLESRLLQTYDREFSRVVSGPLSSVVKMVTSAVEKRAAESAATEAKVQTLINELEREA
ncbi:hypothetical protein HDU82_006297 [Entophlyctis luteolus]|nr:hypothetical protein HDU82_006297 [Entophlyctis luteolus]